MIWSAEMRSLQDSLKSCSRYTRSLRSWMSATTMFSLLCRIISEKRISSATSKRSHKSCSKKMAWTTFQGREQRMDASSNTPATAKYSSAISITRGKLMNSPCRPRAHHQFIRMTSATSCKLLTSHPDPKITKILNTPNCGQNMTIKLWNRSASRRRSILYSRSTSRSSSWPWTPMVRLISTFMHTSGNSISRVLTLCKQHWQSLTKTKWHQAVRSISFRTSSRSWRGSQVFRSH